MERIDFQKRHQSHGCYEKLVALAKDLRDQRQVSMEAALEAAVAQNRPLAQLALDGPKDPQWTYMPIIKRCMGWTDPDAFRNACIDIVSRQNPAFMKRVGRGEFLTPASALVEKAAPDPIPSGMTATAALERETQRLVQQGVPIAKAQYQAQTEHPSWYPQYLRESRGR